MVDRFLQTIQKQAEEIGRLKEKVAQLEGAAKASPPSPYYYAAGANPNDWEILCIYTGARVRVFFLSGGFGFSFYDNQRPPRRPLPKA